MAKALTLRELSEIFYVSHVKLGEWKKQGVAIHDAREIVKKIQTLRVQPPAWRETWGTLFKEADEDSHEYWKKEKDKAATEGTRLKNAKLAGEMFDRSDGERIQQAWAAVLGAKVADLKATLPQTIAGKDEPEIRSILEGRLHTMLEEMSDFEDAAWKETFDKYAGIGNDTEDDAPAPAPKKRAKKK